MFTFLQSAAAKLAAHTSRSADTPVKSGIIIERSYHPTDLLRHFQAFESQDETLLGNVRSVGRRVLGKAKKLLTRSTRTLPVSPSDESFCSPGNLDDDYETETTFNPIRRPSHVQKSQDACTDVHCSVHGHWQRVADAEDLYGPRYEEDRPVSMLSDDSDYSDDSHQYQEDLSAILEESECQQEPDESEYSAKLVVDEDGDVDEMEVCPTPSVSETGDGTVRIETQAGGDAGTPSDFEYTPTNNGSSPFPVSPYFCLPTTESTLAPLTPAESESGPSTPRYMPVLLYESASYEDALFAEFKAILDWRDAN